MHLEKLHYRRFWLTNFISLVNEISKLDKQDPLTISRCVEYSFDKYIMNETALPDAKVQESWTKFRPVVQQVVREPPRVASSASSISEHTGSFAPRGLDEVGIAPPMDATSEVDSVDYLDLVISDLEEHLAPEQLEAREQPEQPEQPQQLEVQEQPEEQEDA
jgi:hypothetical protein